MKNLLDFSINVRGMAPFGYSTTMNLRQAKSFQEKSRHSYQQKLRLNLLVMIFQVMIFLLQIYLF